MDLLLLTSQLGIVLAALTGAALAAGMLVKPGTPTGPPSLLDLGMTLALGLAVLGQGLLLLGFLGILRLEPVLGLLAALPILAFWRHRQRCVDAATSFWTFGKSPLGIGSFVLLLPVFVLALYPPIGFDQTLYHLPFSRAFVRTGALPFLPELRFPVFPQLVEVLQAGVWIVADEIATQVVGFLALLALLALVFGWAREKAGREAGYFASALLIGSPCVVYLATCGYLEPVLALFVTGALYAAEKSRENAEVGELHELYWALAAGFLAGSAAASKYHGLFFLAMAPLFLLRRESWPARLRRLSLFALAGLFAAGPSYARIVALTGNPLFPFYPEFFGSGPFTEESLMPRGGQRLERVTTLMWDLVFRRELVGHLPPYTPFFLLALPAAFLALRKRREGEPELWRPALVALLFLLISPTHGHYFSTIAPCWALVLAGMAAPLWREAPSRRRLVVAASLLIVLGGPAYAVYRIGQLGLPPTSAEERSQFLAQQLPLYRAIATLNREAPGETVFAAGPLTARMTSYLDGILLGDINGVDSVVRVAIRSQELGSVAAALAEIDSGWLLLDVDGELFLRLAQQDDHLELFYQDPHATIFRVRPPSAAAP